MPRLVVVVANGITGDSRVQKSAIAAARDGWEVILLGITKHRLPQHSMMGPIRVVRVPVGQGERLHTDRKMLRRLTRLRLGDKAAVRGYHNKFHRRNAYGTAVSSWLGRKPTPLKLMRVPVKALMRVHELGYKARMKAYHWGQRPPSTVTGDWRRDYPHLVDLSTSLGPVIEDLKPDLIHANDITTLGVVAEAVERMRSRGEQVAWFYDAHEYVRGIKWPTPAMASAFPAIEDEYIRSADAVSTVSPELAQLIAGHYGLTRLPTVVQNAPVREVPPAPEPKPSVRAAAGLGDDVDLLVYSGWIAPERGVEIVIEALPALPTCHFAIVTGRSTPLLEQFLRRASELNVRDRVHVLPYVPQHLVPTYLSTADLGTICFQRAPAYENSLPTKMAEYAHAGLPVVVNDLKSVREFVRKHDIGEVFTDTPAQFADAVGRALARRKELAANIDEPILRELSWEHQSEVLLGLYRELSAHTPTGSADVSWDVQEHTPIEVSPHTGPLGRWKPLGDTEVRLGVGPANYAGQAAGIAQAISRANADVSVEVMMRTDERSIVFPADVYLDTGKLHGVGLQIGQSKRIIGRYTHLIADAFLPVFGSLHGHSIADDLTLLRNAGVKVALLAHGSEVRHPLRHMERHANSIFRDAPEGIVESYSVRAERNRRIADESGLPVFVTTPDLIADLPGAQWVPLVVDVDSWASPHPIMQRKRPLVLHGPSKRWTKGTDRILGPLTELHDKGVIELELAEGITWPEMKKLVQRADIVLDQFGTGSYGVFAVEAMAAGRPVLAYLEPSLSEIVGAEPPIVNTTADTLIDKLLALVEDRDGTVARGAASVAYARAYHDGRRTAATFADFLAS